MEQLHVPLSANEFEFTSYIVITILYLTIIMPNMLLSRTKTAKSQQIFSF